MPTKGDRCRERGRTRNEYPGGLFNSSFYAPLTNTIVTGRGASAPTFARATAAWDFDNEGKLNLNIPSGAIRFTGARLVRNRVVGSSEDFTNASWTKSRATVVGNKLLDSVDNATHRIYQGGGIPTGTWVLYAELKASELTQAALGVTNNVETGFGRFIFDLVNGTVGSNLGAYSGSASMTPLDNGYFGCQIIVTVPSTEASSALHINTAKSDLVSYIGTGTDGVLIRKAQAELVSGQADQTASEYVSVGVLASPYHGAGTASGADGCKWFASNKDGSAVSDLRGYLAEPSRVNNCLWGRDQRTREIGLWVTNTTGAAAYTTDFSVSTGWTLENGYTISGGKLNWAAGSGREAYVVISGLTVGKHYLCQIAVEALSGTTLALYASGLSAGNYTSTTKTLSCLFVAANTTTTVRIRNNTAAGSATLDNLTVTEAAIQVTTTTGLDNIANSASRLTATANDATILQLLTAATGTRTTSAWIKRISGSGTVSLTRNGGTNWTDITSSLVTDTWVPVEVISDVGANPTVGLKMGTSGDVIDVDCFQDENGAWRTSPILTTTAAVTRNADVLSYASAFDVTQGTALCSVKSNVPTAYAAYALGSETAARVIFWNDGTSRSQGTIYDGTSSTSATGSSILTGTRKRVSKWGAAAKSICADGGTVIAGAFDGAMGISGTVYVGCDSSSTNQISGNIRNIHIWNTALTDAQLQQVTK